MNYVPETTYREGLPEVPKKMRALPIQRGFPVPWFVAWVDEEENPVPARTGRAEFRVIKPGAIQWCITQNACWVCGGPLGTWKAFVIGPMCAVNRITSEPPCHLECARFSAIACPFLSRPHASRRENGLPEDAVDAPGIPIDRNPGVSAVWVVKNAALSYFGPSPNSPGVLFHLSEPDRVEFYSQGRGATREEVEESIDSGTPRLFEVTESDEERAELTKLLDATKAKLLPAAAL